MNWSQEKEEATQRQTLKHAEDKRTLILNNSCMVATHKNETNKQKKNIQAYERYHLNHRVLVEEVNKEKELRRRLKKKELIKKKNYAKTYAENVVDAIATRNTEFLSMLTNQFTETKTTINHSNFAKMLHSIVQIHGFVQIAKIACLEQKLGTPSAIFYLE